MLNPRPPFYSLRLINSFVYSSHPTTSWPHFLLRIRSIAAVRTTKAFYSSSVRTFAQMDSESVKFGPYKIDPKEVFYATQLSYALVNLRPVVPDLTADEVSDLWLSAQKIGSRLETYHKASSLTYAIQIDLKEKELKQNLDLDKERKDRSMEEMAEEADSYRKLLL
ncbi:bis(5'-adenosyl)-triphosphatase-like protein [Striga asiatica]|uniref:Bis(5'-adenosyl)-triphosphatase-like protein n=1 Tax=Striga asiatica TaxID=4170 RepID=A0A5A7REE8_STRAF|nr:bis(5'-adenosyl)-triphosphatase-like protein [Striga asiatica]